MKLTRHDGFSIRMMAPWLFRAQAQHERAEREYESRARDLEKRFRERIRQMNARAGALRRDGLFVEAAEIDQQIQDMLREHDPDLQRANELKQRAAQARLDGKHKDADLYDRQANELLQR